MDVPLLLLFLTIGVGAQEVLNPPYFNLAEGRKIVASATCGVGVNEPELYCKLVGANTDSRDNPNINLIQGQVCDYCDPSNPATAHPAEHAIDGTERWYQSPPLSRGTKYNEVNLTIHLGQEFHVAYVFIKMGNSPRPGVWVLERSTDDNGETFTPWQYFADSPGDCVQMFGPEALQQRIVKDDTVICETKFSKVVPLVGGEIVVSLLNDRPNADNFSYSVTLQEWTKATSIRLRFLRTKTLLGHLMSVARQDPTVTRRYFYSIKDINIGGRCVCNGHAETCDLTDPRDPYKLLCRCQHNTCGPNCEQCCPGFKQKRWRRAILQSPFLCEPCNCFGHSNECVYDEETDRKRLSLDIYGHYEGGGICQNCRHNTQGINCNQCRPTFYRPYGKPLNATDVCQPCNCDVTFSTGNCEDGTGQCECRAEFLPPYCDDCNVGYYGYPKCKLCDCHPNGTHGNVCEVGGGQCPCKSNYGGRNCDACREGFFGFHDCIPCNCNPSTSVRNVCDQEEGQCPCRGNYGGRQCDRCRAGYYNYPTCDYCSCDPTGCVAEICDSVSGACLCREGYGGPSCDRCAPGYFGYPVCEKCGCDGEGSFQDVCDISGRCQCLPSFSGLKCDQCSPGYYDFPRCHACDCESIGSNGVSCDSDGQCVCHRNFDGPKCDRCKEGFYNYPYCEECNCDPAGVVSTFEGCGSVKSGQLCECKERVRGRICNECKSLYWNLKVGNPLGCEDCDCYLGGTVGGTAACAKTNGQCVCKTNVGSRQCSECKDGSYQLDPNNLFGCKDCECDIGGSVNGLCEKEGGQCPCRPRISGRRCDRPLQNHFFPTLFQHQFEIEDGRTPVGTQVRYGYEEAVFPRFSWRGYAVFSSIQKEVLLDLYIEKPSLYQVFFHYLNFGGEPVYGTITFTPEKFGDIQQSSDMVFETTTQPKFMKVSGKQGLLPSPFVLNPGRWTVSIRVEKPLFLDYMVLLPQSYYEATLLQQHVSRPCPLLPSPGTMCLTYRHPPLPMDAEVVRGSAGYYVPSDGDRMRTNTHDEAETLTILQTDRMAWLDSEQTNLHLDFTLSRPGPHVVVVTYHTPQQPFSTTATIHLEQSSPDQDEEAGEEGKVTFYECGYSFMCRQVVLDDAGEVLLFNLESNYVTAKLQVSGQDIAVDSVALVPAHLWHTDYIVPRPLCIRKDGACIESEYPPAPEATKVEFQESGYNEYNGSDDAAVDIALVSLQENDNVVDLKGSVPSPGLYSFVIHYYQPEHPAFKAKVVVQTEDFQEGVLLLSHCPRSSGCRAVARSKDTDTPVFHVNRDFHLNIRQPSNKTVWLAYVLAVPAREFHEDVLEPVKQDMAGKFITECGHNSFLLPSDATGFCRESAFSLTAEYNNGALPCQCDTDGSLSYECESFGGQCQCRPNVIGRTCSQCRTGFFGFPNCKPCDCPSTAYCQPVTGQCICPPRVMGDKCDTCVPYTYGFDPIIGCEECNCNPLGVLGGQLQCDLSSGQCRCKSNIVGRTCDRCKAGYWAFPHCQLCNCDLRGSTEDICEQDSARCFCKENVWGDSCDQCKPGTFYLEEVNPLGCTKCFCFGATDRCSSGHPLFHSQVYRMSGWKGESVRGGGEVRAESGIALSEDARVVLPPEWPQDDLFYFSAPQDYLGNKLTSYGGKLTYTVSIESDSGAESIVGPDVILAGNNITIVHVHVEEPATGAAPFRASVDLLEREFRHVSGREVSREQMMMVLVNLEKLLLRGSYFHPATHIQLSGVIMDAAQESYIADAPQVLRVEQCQCPPNYGGNSCEECAPGYYRSKTGPYLGYCVPCQCHGHAQTCDVNTGKCIGCEHNTVGDECERCAAGYHGDSTRGTPYDCLICACPLPLQSNNFAESCEVSPSGHEIHCNCKPEYYGPRCEYCAIGYFGSPEVLGSRCQPCQCSGNIDPGRPGSCDSVTGDCIMCLNNTFGAACELCAPGFYGDAISAKDCRKCKCDECGTRDCDHESGECICWANVVGTSCDRCEDNHWGFHSCSGCRPCNCGPASEDEQCDLQTGHCKCKPGAGGLTCDVCEPGYWQYSEDGCISCNCVERYSSGVMCNSVSGQCECLPGVVGEKCDSCPHRWVFVKNQGCYECGTCVHGLLDTTDDLEDALAPVTEEMKDVSLSYFANRRLDNVNKTADALKVGVETLGSSNFDYSPLVFEVQLIEKAAESGDRTAAHLHSEGVSARSEANSTRSEALEVEKLIRGDIAKVRGIIEELGRLSEGLQEEDGEEEVDALVARAERVLKELLDRHLAGNEEEDEYDSSTQLLEAVRVFGLPVLEERERCEEEGEKLTHAEDLLEDLRKDSQNAYAVADSAQALHEELESMSVEEKITSAELESGVANGVLQNASDLLNLATGLTDSAPFKDLGSKSERLAFGMIDLKDQLKDSDQLFRETDDLVREASEHATFLTEQADLLEESLADTRDSSEGAVQAANAYANIGEAINDAYLAAESALTAANSAESMSEGVLERTRGSKEATNQLLDSALLLDREITSLEPRLQGARQGVLLISHQNGKAVRGLDAIHRDLEKLPLYSLGVLAEVAANNSALADQRAEAAVRNIERLTADRLPRDERRAGQIPGDVEDSRQAVKAGHSYADRVSSIVPETTVLAERVGRRGSALKILGTDVSEKLAKLQQKIAVARTQANRIKLGVQFFENTTLQLRNPEGLSKAATYTRLSLYFRTTERFGLLAFLGNEKGAHNRMRNVITDDYLALEIRAGLLVLIMDIGSGSEIINHGTYVSDGRWHQVIIERTGKTCSLTVRTDKEEDSVVEGFLPGTYSVFNLDPRVSKFFIGGVRESHKLPETLQNFHFDGCIEDVVLGDEPVGLWNFAVAENNGEGCAERNELDLLQPSNGLRFNGAGYALLPGKKHKLARQTVVKLQFKTYAQRGLLFFAGKNKEYFAVEMEDGHVQLKYELGSGPATIRSEEAYNDGEWHSLDASRFDRDAVLKVDEVEAGSGSSPGNESTLSFTNQMFIGGYPRRTPPHPVHHQGFEGCIMDVQIGATAINLNQNDEALGVVNGCPVTIARTVSFTGGGGHVVMPPVRLGNLAQLTFKFKTAEEDGLIFYAADDAARGLSVSLRKGGIVMESVPGGEIKTVGGHYNDREWHYVSATKALRQMRLDIDDIHSVEIELSEDATLDVAAPLHFGGRGPPQGGGEPSFIGCIGDATVNNKFQNFADALEMSDGTSLASCPLGDPPVLPTEEDQATTGSPPPVPEEEEEEEPVYVGSCSLPLHPRRDRGVRPGDGTRFGDTVNSRQELSRPNSFMDGLQDDSTFALEFRSSLQQAGVLFYVSDAKHIDYVALFMLGGKVVYVFNCGSGSALVSSQKTYNDGTWHRVVFSRRGREGRLVVDDEEEVRGASQGTASSMNVRSPFFVGGLSEEVAREAKNNLKGVTHSFPGCIRNVEAQGDILHSPSPHNVTACSDKVEEGGAYFSALGGHLVLFDKYRVGQRVSVTLDIKPRKLSGILMSVHGKKDFLLLQMAEGRVEVRVDNGAGPIVSSFTPTDEHYLCDGEWHTVQVVKSNNFVTLSVDGIFSDPGIGVGGVSATDTNDPLFIGGLPPEESSRRGVPDPQYVGCMRYLELDSKPQQMQHSRVVGHVTLNTCPTT